jgi:hypothetical protein
MTAGVKIPTWGGMTIVATVLIYIAGAPATTALVTGTAMMDQGGGNSPSIYLTLRPPYAVLCHPSSLVNAPLLDAKMDKPLPLTNNLNGTPTPAPAPVVYSVL